jgi:thioredoxin-like negative regulator of GroEL
VSGLLYQLRDDFPDRLRLARANAQTNGGTVSQFKVRGTPTVLLFHKGRLLKRWSGQVDLDELYAQVEGLVAAGDNEAKGGR